MTFKLDWLLNVITQANNKNSFFCCLPSHTQISYHKKERSTYSVILCTNYIIEFRDKYIQQMNRAPLNNNYSCTCKINNRL